MATGGFSTGKTLIILAIVIGCFALLWPKIFFPIIRTATKPKIPESKPREPLPKRAQAVCCGVIYEANINTRYFDELCDTVLKNNKLQSLVDTSSKLSQLQGLPGIEPDRLNLQQLESCRKALQKLCHVDIGPALHPEPILSPQARQAFLALTSSNLTRCLEDNFKVVSPQLWKQERKPRIVPERSVRQERPMPSHPTALHPAMRERGAAMTLTKKTSEQTVAPKPPPKPPLPGKRPMPGLTVSQTPSQKGSGFTGFIMPLYTVGITGFFIYTMCKVVFKRQAEPTSERRRSSACRKVEHNGDKLANDDGRKIVVSAIEDIMAEIDAFRTKIKGGQQTNHVPETSELDESPEPFCEEDVDAEVVRREPATPTATVKKDVATVASGKQKEAGVKTSSSVTNKTDEEQWEDWVDQEEQKTPTRTPEKLRTASPGLRPSTPSSGGRPKTPTERSTLSLEEIQQSGSEISNIVLEASMPSETQLLVYESQCKALPAPGYNSDDIENEEDIEEQPVIITGKMTISLISGGKTSPDLNRLGHSLQDVLSGVTKNEERRQRRDRDAEHQSVYNGTLRNQSRSPSPEEDFESTYEDTPTPIQSPMIPRRNYPDS